MTALAWGLALYGEADLAGGLAGASEAALSGWGAAL
jgi:hypothetical protein